MIKVIHLDLNCASAGLTWHTLLCKKSLELCLHISYFRFVFFVSEDSCAILIRYAKVKGLWYLYTIESSGFIWTPRLILANIIYHFLGSDFAYRTSQLSWTLTSCHCSHALLFECSSTFGWASLANATFKRAIRRLLFEACWFSASSLLLGRANFSNEFLILSITRRFLFCAWSLWLSRLLIILGIVKLLLNCIFDLCSLNI